MNRSPAAGRAHERSLTFRIAYLVKEYVVKMIRDEAISVATTPYEYARSSTSIRIAIPDPDYRGETCYEVRVRRLGRRRFTP